jgi:predicted aminopeptidase
MLPSSLPRHGLRLAACVPAILAALLSLCSCTELSYVTQAAAGQDDLNRRANDIDELVRERRFDTRTRRLLASVANIKRFGERHGLKATSNYTKYVHLDRPAAVWVVSASEPLRFSSKRWSFPLVGSFTYLGWFKLDQARSFADGLRKEGWDVDLRGASAYSTEGFFEDSVLSTMIPPGHEALGELADTLLHESSHATFFVRHQSALNESVANFVGTQLSEVYLHETVGNASDEMTSYLTHKRTSEVREDALRRAYRTLEALYASKEPDADKLAKKFDIVTRLRAETRFKRPINNATLIQFKTYNSGQEELAALLHTCKEDWPRFMRALKRLESSRVEPPQQKEIGPIVRPLIEAGCSG